MLSYKTENFDYMENKLIGYYQFLKFCIQSLVKYFIIFLGMCHEHVM